MKIRHKTRNITTKKVHRTGNSLLVTVRLVCGRVWALIRSAQREREGKMDLINVNVCRPQLQTLMIGSEHSSTLYEIEDYKTATWEHSDDSNGMGEMLGEKSYSVCILSSIRKRKRISADFYAEHCSSEWTQILDKCLIGNQFSCLFFPPPCFLPPPTSSYEHTFISCTTYHNLQNIFSLYFPKLNVCRVLHMSAGVEEIVGKLCRTFIFIVKKKISIWNSSIPLYCA